jgi:Bacterial alpha-L-rhamnosidase 6 hairpin glycosidase domain/Alpha-L-rhamnosidase N-terminal domain/Bacterial alpha-L-rhamnosidase C-terminal domain/Bacterial alpha-L-rhamnosidase concanavalin-like domain
MGQGTFRAEGLRCEYLVDPLGIDVEKPRLSWILASDERGQAQSAYRIVVASSKANLEQDQGDLWDSSKVASDQTTFVPYAGRPLTSGTQCLWKVRVWDRQGRDSQWSKPAMWSMGLLAKADWYARWIGAERSGNSDPTSPLPFPWFRKTFALEQKPQRTTAYVNSLGYYELYVNGKKVDDQVLAPAVSDYSKRNLYVTHDITDLLVKGKNCVALWLGRGWYVKGHPGVVHEGPMARVQIDGLLPGGATVRIGTDASWKVKESPITPLGKGLAFGDYGGEHYDARLELKDWNATDLDDSDWKPAMLFEPPDVITAAQMVQPNRITQTLKPVKVQDFATGGYLIDMGKNYVGWLELHFPDSLAAGKTIKLDYADNQPSGTRFANLNQRDEYVTREGPGQVFCSRFNYHGFRYVRVTGMEQPPGLDDAKGYLIHTDYQPAGEFECSNELLNRIYQTVTWTYRMLTLGGYVVDCPTRERLGYGGDAGTSMETGMFNFDTGGLYNRWSANWRDAQDPKTGDLPYTAPAYPDKGGGGPMWSGFSITLPWQLYVQYGDKRILETSYPTIQKYLAFLDTKTVDHLLEPYVTYGIRMPEWNYLGDWVTPRRGPQGSGPRDPKVTRLINNCYYLYNLQLAGKIANILGKNEDAARYEEKAGSLRRVLHERYYNADQNTYASGEQPCLAFPLLVNVVPEAQRESVLKKLEETILVKNGGHLDSGMHGTYFMLRELMRDDRNDLIFEMVNKKTYPGWGYMLEQGATTMWESWDGGGSHIHDTLISIGAWFIEGIGGIRFDEKSPGFKHFFIKPALVGDLTFARASYKSIHGKILSDWRIQDGSLQLNLTVPAGTTATVWIPTTAPADVTEGGRPTTESKGVVLREAEKGKAVYSLESGQYKFVSKLAPR